MLSRSLAFGPCRAAGVGSRFGEVPIAAILPYKKRDALGFCVKNMSEDAGRRSSVKNKAASTGGLESNGGLWFTRLFDDFHYTNTWSSGTHQCTRCIFHSYQQPEIRQRYLGLDLSLVASRGVHDLAEFDKFVVRRYCPHSEHLSGRHFFQFMESKLDFSWSI